MMIMTLTNVGTHIESAFGILSLHGHWFSLGLNDEDNDDVAEHNIDDNDAYECGNSH